MTGITGNGWEKHQALVLARLEELKAGQVLNRETNNKTSQNLAVLSQSVADLKDTVVDMVSISRQQDAKLAEKADAQKMEAELKSLRRQGGIVGALGGALMAVALWLRGKM